MFTGESVQALIYTGGIALAITAIITAIGVIYTKVVRPVFRGIRRLGQMADQFLGDKEKNIPSLPDQVREIQAKVDAHLAQYHPTLVNGHVQTRTTARGRR